MSTFSTLRRTAFLVRSSGSIHVSSFRNTGNMKQSATQSNSDNLLLKKNKSYISMGAADNGCDGSQTKMATTNNKQTPLLALAQAFEDLSEYLESQIKDEGLRLDRFCDACSLVPVLFNCLGLAFKFAEMEYVAKVGDLAEASKRFGTLETVLDLDVANKTVKKQGSHSRNLRRVRLGLDLIRALFEEFLSSEDYPLKVAASTAYGRVCAPYHTWAVRTAAYAGMRTLPTREQLLRKLNETNQTAEKKMRRYIKASSPVIEYIDNLYVSRNITLDW